jgi:hypothetical protein
MSGAVQQPQLRGLLSECAFPQLLTAGLLTPAVTSRSYLPRSAVGLVAEQVVQVLLFGLVLALGEVFLENAAHPSLGEYLLIN